MSRISNCTKLRLENKGAESYNRHMNMFKTTDAKSVEELISKIDEPRRSEMEKLHAFIRKTVPKLPIGLYGAIIGYGNYHYKYSSGREGDWMIIGLASQKNYISLYICSTENGEYLAEKYKDELPKANIGKSCIRFKKLEDIDLEVLKEIILKAEKLGGMGAI